MLSQPLSCSNDVALDARVESSGVEGPGERRSGVEGPGEESSGVEVPGEKRTIGQGLFEESAGKEEGRGEEVPAVEGPNVPA